VTDPQPITRDGAARSARHELAKPIYHRGSESLPARVMHAIGRFIDHLLNTTFKHTPGGGLGSLILLAIVIGVVGLIVWRVGLPARNNTAGAVFQTDAPTMSANDHRLRSSRAAEAGDWNTAVVERMRALARELTDRGILDSRPGRTATELAVDAAVQLPAARGSLAAAADTFNRVAYGGVVATVADLNAMIAADQAVASNSPRLISV
jgi:hypothetical protein